VNCQETQLLIHGYLDGELDLMKSLEIEQHLRKCSACARAHASFQAVRAAIKDGSLYLRPPANLLKRIRSSVRKATDASPAPGLVGRRVLAVAASLAFFTTVGWGLVRGLSARSDDSFLIQELVANHVRSQMLPSHRLDVESADSHTVKPWFDGKLDFSPAVRHLADQGFALIGGRLEYIHNRPVAALVYQRRKHSVNLFIWPSPGGAETAPRTVTRKGYHLIQWTRSGMLYWAVSDLNERELQDYVNLMRS
jgi:anti-sigma factor RsiW